MKLSNLSLVVVLFFGLAVSSFRLSAQPPKVNDLGVYYYFATYDLYIEKDSPVGAFVPVNHTEAAKSNIYFAQVSVNARSKSISLNLFSREKVQVTTAIFSYPDKQEKFKARFNENGVQMEKTWYVINATKQE